MELELAFLLLLLLIILSSLLNHHLKPSSSHPKPYPIVGNLPHILKLIPRMLDSTTQLLLANPTTDTVVLSPFVFTISPANIHHLSNTHFHNYPKAATFISSLHDFLGHGILNINGEQWKLQRKTASYEFNTKSLRSFILHKVHYEIDHRLFPLLRKASCEGSSLDFQDVLERFAFDNICSLVLGYDPECLYGRSEEGERFFRAFDVATQLSVDRNRDMFRFWKLKKLLILGSERRLKDSMVTVHKLIEEFIRWRKREQLGNGGGGDFLSRFVEDGSYSDEFIRDILISFLLAGRDTTPSALTWFFWLLSTRPHIVGKILKELKFVRTCHNNRIDNFSLDELREMNYLHATITESLRLYPPVPLVPRECKEDDELPDGTKVKKGWLVMYNEYAMARSEKIWGEDCGEFKPERWLDEGGGFKAKNMYEYPVFHAGPRMCLGKEMAYIQMKAVAASILEGFEMEVVEGIRGKHQLEMTMRMEGGLIVRVREKEGRY